MSGWLVEPERSSSSNPGGARRLDSAVRVPGPTLHPPLTCPFCHPNHTIQISSGSFVSSVFIFMVCEGHLIVDFRTRRITVRILASSKEAASTQYGPCNTDYLGQPSRRECLPGFHPQSTHTIIHRAGKLARLLPKPSVHACGAVHMARRRRAALLGPSLSATMNRQDRRLCSAVADEVSILPLQVCAISCCTAARVCTPLHSHLAS